MKSTLSLAALTLAATLPFTTPGHAQSDPPKTESATADAVKASTAQAGATATSAFSVISVIVNYSGSIDLYCPASNPVLVVASCDYSGVLISWGLESPLPPGSTPGTKWTNWLLPNASAATGVHCKLLTPAFSSQARLRCASR